MNRDQFHAIPQATAHQLYECVRHVFQGPGPAPRMTMDIVQSMQRGEVKPAELASMHTAHAETCNGLPHDDANAIHIGTPEATTHEESLDNKGCYNFCAQLTEYHSPGDGQTMSYPAPTHG